LLFAINPVVSTFSPRRIFYTCFSSLTSENLLSVTADG
jgi:hypothetical protein